MRMQVMTHRLLVVARRLVIDRTFRFYAPRSDVLRETIKLDSLPGREHTFFAPGVDLRRLDAVSSHRHVALTVKSSERSDGESGVGVHDRVVIKAKSAARAAQSETFYVTLYTDLRQVKPTETWQVRFTACLCCGLIVGSCEVHAALRAPHAATCFELWAS